MWQREQALFPGQPHTQQSFTPEGNRPWSGSELSVGSSSDRVKNSNHLSSKSDLILQSDFINYIHSSSLYILGFHHNEFQHITSTYKPINSVSSVDSTLVTSSYTWTDILTNLVEGGRSRTHSSSVADF